jgi:uncharacterized protein
MNPNIQYLIPYAGLKAGIHSFDFQTDKVFFAAFDDAMIENGSISATMVLDRKADMMVFDFTFSGSVILPCDRCLDDYEQKIEGEAQYIVKFADREYEEDEVLYITPTEGIINVAPFLYESIVLELPTRRVHEEGKCNEAVIQFISGESTLEPNLDAEKGDADSENPFAKALKDIKLN